MEGLTVLTDQMRIPPSVKNSKRNIIVGTLKKCSFVTMMPIVALPSVGLAMVRLTVPMDSMKKLSSATERRFYLWSQMTVPKATNAKAVMLFA